MSLEGGGFLGRHVGDNEGVGWTVPTGTVTFLMADLDGDPGNRDVADSLDADVSEFREILSQATCGHHGVWAGAPRAGTSITAAFSRASDAIAAALDVHRAPLAEPSPQRPILGVRMAVHTGEALPRPDGTYYGESVTRCAGLRRAAHVGQVLVSEAAYVLAEDDLPEGASLVDLGSQRLSDLGRSQRVWQLAHAGLRRQFPPLRSLDRYRHNLPVQLTPLIGREHHVKDVIELFNDRRLVTLTGSGGVGKTRLALAAAAEIIDR